MIENTEYKPTVVETRNELIEAGRKKEKVILITGELMIEMKKEIIKEKKENKIARTLGKGVLFGVLGCATIPGAIAAFGLGTLLHLVAHDSEHLEKYKMFIVEDDKKEISAIGLVWKRTYFPTTDSVVIPSKTTYETDKTLYLFNDNKCPKCGAKIKNDFHYGKCTKCNRTISRITKLK